MIELSNAGEFRVGDDGTENITVTRDYIGGFPDLVQDEENIETNSGNLWKINNLTSIIYIVSRLSKVISLDRNETSLPTEPKRKNNDMIQLSSVRTKRVGLKQLKCEDLYDKGHLTYEIDVKRICPINGEEMQLLILITSQPKHAAQRMAIRQTWGHFNNRHNISIAFMLGKSRDEAVNQANSKENSVHGDLITGNFIDSYNNLTLKTISYLQWVDENCNRVKYILKTDDDVFINIPRLMNFLETRHRKRVIYGRTCFRWKADRNPKSKYYLTVEEYPVMFYPLFCSGPAYVLTGDIVHDLYMKALKTDYIKLEDVFLTGIVAKSLRIRRISAHDFYNRRVMYDACVVQNIISIHMVSINEQFKLWKLLHEKSKCD